MAQSFFLKVEQIDEEQLEDLPCTQSGVHYFMGLTSREICTKIHSSFILWEIVAPYKICSDYELNF